MSIQPLLNPDTQDQPWSVLYCNELNANNINGGNGSIASGTYTPTVVLSAGVLGTVLKASYMRIGKVVQVMARFGMSLPSGVNNFDLTISRPSGLSANDSTANASVAIASSSTPSNFNNLIVGSESFDGGKISMRLYTADGTNFSIGATNSATVAVFNQYTIA